MNWFLPSLGFLVIAAGMQDLFHTLFHVTDQGNISEYMTLRIWRASRRLAPRHRLLVGPLSFLIVIIFWSASVVFGFAMIYRPFMPQRFIVAPGMDGSRINSFLSAVNLSVSSMITVNMGVQTNSRSLQLAMAIEALLGFAILTASISWLLAIYPVIEHRRSLAHEVSLLHFSERLGIQRLEKIENSELQDLLFGLAAEISTIRTELSQFPITYYFQESDKKSALAPALYYLAEVARDNSGSKRPASTSATVLGGAIDDFLALVEEKYLRRQHPDRWSTLRELLADHSREPLYRPTTSKSA
jgi:hypothetical protein